jgi:hypothetical protein
VSASIILPDAVTSATPCTASASPRASLSPAERDELLALLNAHFDGVIATQFARDLDEKDWVLRIRRDGRLVGFSTLKVYSTHFGQERVNVIYSGDTITEPEVWGSPVLGRTWVPLVRRLVAERPAEPWYWLLLSSGFRTYRFLPIFFREFWPRYDAPTPPPLAGLMAHLARERFGARFDEASGVVRFEHPQRLRECLVTVPDGKRNDPHVAFFLSGTPHGDGDELVCLTALDDANFSAAGRRMMRDVTR